MLLTSESLHKLRQQFFRLKNTSEKQNNKCHMYIFFQTGFTKIAEDEVTMDLN